MVTLSTSDNPNIAVLLDAMRAVSRETEPNRVLYAFGSRLHKIRPVDVFVSISKRGLAPGEYKITRLFRTSEVYGPQGGDDAADEQNPWRDWEEIPTHRGGFVGDVIEEGVPRLFQHVELKGDPALGDDLSDMGSCMAIPLFDAGEAINWTLQFRRDSEGFTLKDLELALLSSNLFGNATRNLVALKRVRELHDQLEKQFEEVARVQQMLLPKRVPKVPGLAIATSYLTSEHAGGDYYDFFEFPDGRWGILIADVSGHGAGAATVMAMLHAILHGYRDERISPDAILTYANERLLAAELEGMFVTAFFAVYDPSKGTLEYSRAGHNPPRIKTGAGAVRALDGAATVPLGIFADFAPTHEIVRLDEGDTIVLYTDGITEAFGPGGPREGDMFGVKRLDAALEHCSGEPGCVVDSVHSALYEHTHSRDREDDQTIVALRYVGGEGGS